MQRSTYDDILTSIAGRFYSDLPVNEKPPRERYFETFKVDLLNFTANGADDPAWMLWIKVQERRLLMSKKERDNSRAFRMSPEDMLFLTESALHLRHHGHILQLRTETIEHISACTIDRNIKVADLAGLHLPNYLWIEWPPLGKHYPPWVSRTIGILISRFVLLDAPHHRLRMLMQQPSIKADYTQEIMKALVENTIEHRPCLGYQLIIAQQDDHGYRFIPCMFGNDITEPLTDMLVLHKEMSDRDRRKYVQAEQVWSNVAIRLLLTAAHKGWCADAEHPVFIENAGSCALPNSSHTLYAMNGVQQREIAIRPDYRTPFKPFAVTNE